MKILIIIISTLFLFSCTKEENNKDEEMPQNLNSMSLNKEEIDLNNIEFTTLQHINLSNNISLSGKIDVNPNSRIDINAPFQGFIRNINLIEGDKVSKGQVLFEIENLDLIHIQSKYVELKNNFKQSEIEFNRQKELIKEKAISEKEFLEFERTHNNLKNSINSIEQELKYYRIDLKKVLESNRFQEKIQVRSDFNAFVKKININNGKFIDKNNTLMELVNTDHLHAELFSPISYRNMIKLNDTISINYNNNSYKAFVYQISKTVDEHTNMFMIHSHFVDDIEIPIGTFVNAQLMANSMSVNAIEKECILSKNGKNIVLTVENEIISEIEVNLGVKNENYQEILNFKDIEGKKIISKGAKAFQNSNLMAN